MSCTLNSVWIFQRFFGEEWPSWELTREHNFLIPLGHVSFCLCKSDSSVASKATLSGLAEPLGAFIAAACLSFCAFSVESVLKNRLEP